MVCVTLMQVFWNVTLPNIRWGLMYGIILTNAVRLIHPASILQLLCAVQARHAVAFCAS